MKYDLHRWWLISTAHSGSLAPKKGHGFHTQWYVGETLTNPLPMRLTRLVVLQKTKDKKLKYEYDKGNLNGTPYTFPIPFLALGMCSTSLYSSSDHRSFHLKHIKNQTHFGYFHKEFHEHHMQWTTSHKWCQSYMIHQTIIWLLMIIVCLKNTWVELIPIFASHNVVVCSLWMSPCLH